MPRRSCPVITSYSIHYTKLYEKATQALHEAGQSLWLDNITRTLLDEGTLAKYIAELSVTGLTSNPTIFEKAITGGDTYDEQVHGFHGSDMTDEQVFFEAAISDLQRAADLFGDIHTRTVITSYSIHYTKLYEALQG